MGFGLRASGFGLRSLVFGLRGLRASGFGLWAVVFKYLPYIFLMIDIYIGCNSYVVEMCTLRARRLFLHETLKCTDFKCGIGK